MTQTGRRIEFVNKGDRPKADEWNKIAQTLTNLQSVGGAINIIATGAGVFVRETKQKFFLKLGKTTEAIPKGELGTVKFWKGDLGEESEKSVEIEAYNRGEDLASGIWVNIIKRGGGYECFPLECNP